MTYSYFSSKAGAETLVLETGWWNLDNKTTTTKEDKLALAVSIKINGESNILIPAEGEIEVFYIAAVSDEYGKLLADEAIKWQLREEVEGVLFDEETVTLHVSSNASPGCVTLVAYASSGTEVFAELVIALIKDDQPAQVESEELEPEVVDDGSVDTEGSMDDLSVNELD